MRSPTPADRLVDARGRPYFLWDVDLTLEACMAPFLGRRKAFWAWWLAQVGRAVDAQ